MKKPAQKSLFTWNFKCYREDECEGILVDALEDSDPLATEPPPIYACKFGEGDELGHLLALANEDGQIALRDTRRKNNTAPLEGTLPKHKSEHTELVKCTQVLPQHLSIKQFTDHADVLFSFHFPSFQSVLALYVTSFVIAGQKIHNNAIFDVCWVPGARELVSASGDHQTLVLALRQDGSLVPLLQLLGHVRSVKTVHVNPFDPSEYTPLDNNFVLRMYCIVLILDARTLL